MTLHSSSILDSALVVSAIAHLLAVVALAVATARRQRPVVRPGTATVLGVAVYAASAVGTAVIGFDWRWATAAAAVGSGEAAVFIRRVDNFRPSGALTWSTLVFFSVASAAWTLHFLGTMNVGPLTLGLLAAAAVAAGVAMPSSLVQTLESWEVLLRARWYRPGRPLTRWVPGPDAPKVSIHVPIHAEPAAVVIATLDRLADLDYPNFEVLVVDNNTSDPSLWQPVERHCLRLGEPFRFFHVDGLPGAKAGALNWALPRSHPDAEIIAVVDADYQVDPAWLSDTVGYFEDTAMGFVQCPHAYRDFARTRFGRMANAEYSVFFATSMVALNERGAGITVGTMSLVRRRALEQVGGWAEWCLTEDSELAIRLHAAGYRSVYISKPYGWGLIPSTFASYKKQRFRWTYGPVQEFLHHVRLWRLPAATGRPGLDRRQRLHHANHGLDVAMVTARTAVVVLGGAGLASMVVNQEIVRMPFSLWLAATVLLVTSFGMRWLVYTRAVGQTLSEAVGGMVAFWALYHVIALASLSALTRRPAEWDRTDKSGRASSRRSVLSGVIAETVLATACIASAATALVALPHGGIGTALAIGLLYQGAVYATSPVVAFVAHRGIRSLPSVASLGPRLVQLSSYPALEPADSADVG
jgi:hypothetical protein